MFERPVVFTHGDGSLSQGRIDCYLKGHFVLEAKKLKASTQTKGFDDGLLRARAQGEGYARALPPEEGRPPFVIVVDVGNVIELYAEFSCTGGTYIPFPTPRTHRIELKDLGSAEVLQRLKLVWTDPLALDPTRISAQVTRKVSQQLAKLARSLESDGHSSEVVAAYLSRCLFSMFAEDVELLPPASFTTLLERHQHEPEVLQPLIRTLWADMDKGGFSPALAKSVLRFNGKMFKKSSDPNYSLLLRPEQIGWLLDASRSNWNEVEPAIFGTLLERALDPTERHSLGAHYTPRSYVERLVMPTVIEPLRKEWALAQAAALTLAHEASVLEANPPEVKAKKDFAALDRHNALVRGKWSDARKEVEVFLHRLCTVRVLDPACGSANFLYVTLEHLKRLEGEVINQLRELGNAQSALGMLGETVTLQQLVGIELNERAAALAELVLWIGFLQWQLRTNGRAGVEEPVVHDYGNIEHRDAVLAYTKKSPLKDSAGKPISRWDGLTTKSHPVTGLPVPDETATVPIWHHENPSQAGWPKADFIVGNPPFIGNKRMRFTLGDGYVDALRSAWPEVPESADFVMYWWHRAAEAVRNGEAERFGLITTNSLTMIFNRRVIESHQGANPSLSLVYAIPDHPWVDSTDGAAVRIAMSVGQRGAVDGEAITVTSESEGENGEISVALTSKRGKVHSDLTVGVDLNSCHKLKANLQMAHMGMIPLGSGFWIDPARAKALGLGKVPGMEQHVRRYVNGKDLTGTPRGVLALDFYGLSEQDLRQRFPAAYQWLHDEVMPGRQHDKRASYRQKWWIFAEPRKDLRPALANLKRYIGTTETAKHRTFVFIEGDVLPDQKVRAIASDDAFHLGVLSSQVHVKWALAVGGTLEDRPVYNTSRCFAPFPFPSEDTGLTPKLTGAIRALGEQLDAHRKARQSAHAEVTLTGLYNVLEKLRSGEALTAKEKAMHELGLVGVLKSLHDELDRAVLQAYGWTDLNLPADADKLLERLVALNARRTTEEATGTVRWLRPEFQQVATQTTSASEDASDQPEQQDSASSPGAPHKAPAAASMAWPAGLTEQIKGVAHVFSQAPGSLSLEELAAHFKGRGRWKDRLPTLVDTLVALGQLRPSTEGKWAVTRSS